jgi:hypothetical protein
MTNGEKRLSERKMGNYGNSWGSGGVKLFIVSGFDFFSYRRIFGVYDKLDKAGIRQKELEHGGEYSLNVEISEVELNNGVDI